MLVVQWKRQFRKGDDFGSEQHRVVETTKPIPFPTSASKDVAGLQNVPIVNLISRCIAGAEVGLGLGLGLGSRLGLGLGLGLGSRLGFGVGLRVGKGVGSGVGLCVGIGVGRSVGGFRYGF